MRDAMEIDETRPSAGLLRLLAGCRRIHQSLDRAMVARQVVEAAAELTGADVCLLLLASEGDRVSVVECQGVDPERAAGFSARLDEQLSEALNRQLGLAPERLRVARLTGLRVRGVLVATRRGMADEDSLFAQLGEQAAVALDLAAIHTAAVADAHKAKELFFNALSHELRTPLAATLLALDILHHPGADEEQRARARTTIERNVRQQVRLIDDLLDAARIARGRVLLDRTLVDLREPVRAAAREAESEARRQGVEWRLTLPPQPIMVSGDKSRLAQVVRVLMENAIAFTEPAGKVEISVEGEGEQAVLRVRDSGLSLSDEIRTRVQGPLPSLDRLPIRSAGGVGIGLSVARWLIEEHGGTTAVASERTGPGSEFIVRLPKINETPQRESAPAPAAPTRPLRVLVVEDNHDLLQALQSILGMLGQQVVLAQSGLTALERAEHDRPDLALVDIGLPDIDGFEVARRVRRSPALAGLRLVALTGFASEEDRARAREVGFDEFLIKPIDTSMLRAVLARSARVQPSSQGGVP